MGEQPINKIRLLVGESFELVRMGLRELFENHPQILLVDETDCIEDLLALSSKHKPDVVLIDLQLNNGNCAEHIVRLLLDHPDSKVLVISDKGIDEQICLQTFRSGAVGIISKQHSSELLLKAIIAIYSGQVWFDRHITKLLWQAQFGVNTRSELQPETHAQSNHHLKLSESERRIAYLACKGLPAKRISTHLSLAEKTVRNQLSKIYKKTGVNKQIELCLKAPLYNYFEDPASSGTFSQNHNEIE